MKKIFKNIIVYSFLLLSVYSFSSCQEYEINSQPVAPLSINIDAMDEYSVLATSPSNVVFNISSNTPWNIISDQQWCKVTPAMSASSSLVSEIVVTCEDNNSSVQRVAQLTIKAEGLETTKVVKITQVSKENLVVIPFDETVPTDGADISFNIISNKPWQIIPSTQFLENIDKTSGTGNETGEKETITIKIPANSGARRNGTITVKTDYEEFTFTVNQDGVVIEQEEPSETGSIDFNGGEKEKLIKIRSNKEWKVEVPKEYSEWLVATKVSDSELKINVVESNRLSVREAKIKLTTIDIIPGFEGVELTITQKPNFWFTASEGKFVVDENTGNVRISQIGNNTVVSNYSFKKGKLVFEFEEMNITDNGRLVFNMWPNAGNTNFHFWLRSDKNCQYTCGGSGFAWQQVTFPLTLEEVNNVRKVVFYVEDDPENEGKLRLRLEINDKEYGVLKNKTDVYITEDPQNPGQNVNLGLYDAPEGNYYVVKSITHYPEN